MKTDKYTSKKLFYY